ncbi:MAG: hypothetical protein SCM96_01940 [Acidobacteriota bacterium]|nr:hypothetical protein [Acidobacteriota bacterium]
MTFPRFIPATWLRFKFIMPPALTILLMAGCADPSPEIQKDTGPDLRFGITGTIGDNVPDARHPFRLLERPEIQKLVFELADSSRSESYLEDRLDGTGLTVQDLEAAGVVREEAGLYFLDFCLLTADDVKQVSAEAARYGAGLAAAVLERREELDPLLLEMSPPGVAAEATAFIVMGCFMLDWYGGFFAKDRGYADSARTHGNGSRYSLWAVERPSLDLKGMYWGSHNDYREGRVLSSFGDHHALPRTAFPDLLRRLRSAVRRVETDPSIQPLLADLATDKLDRLADDVGAIMLGLRSRDLKARELSSGTGIEMNRLGRILDLLERLDYIETDKSSTAVRAVIPVLAAEDAVPLRKIRDLTAGILETWLEENYETLRESLGDITPLRFDVPFNEVFIQVWHEIFGAANKALAAEDWYAAPYARRYPGFIPAVWDRSLSDVIRN